MDCTLLLLCLINKCNPYRKNQYILHIANDAFKMIAHCSCHVLSTSAKYIAFYDMDCILLQMPSRWFKVVGSR